MANLRKEVLRVYRDILRVARSWQSGTQMESATLEEREYIRQEARFLFRKNSLLREEEEIVIALQEAKSRLQMALHYKSVNTQYLFL